MPQQQLDKRWHQLNLGINTEQSEITFEDGFTRDEVNYELLVDGSRRRRKGLRGEQGGSSKTLDASQILGTDEATQSYLWKNVGGDSTKRFWVHKLGNRLYFTDDDDTPSSSWDAKSIDLDGNRLGPNTNASTPVDFAQGRGYLFVSGARLKPIYIEYDATADEFIVTPIELQIRDFTDIDDGISIGERPTSLTEDHEYNLLNRGWRDADITAYNSSESEYPSKNQIWHKGYRRSTVAGYADATGGELEFNAAKMASELFANASAPRGSLYVRVFNDQYGFYDVNPDGSATVVQDTTPTTSVGASEVTVTVDQVGHGYTATTTEVLITEGNWVYELDVGDSFSNVNLANTVVTVSATPTADTWQFTFDVPVDYGAEVGFGANGVKWEGTSSIPRSSGTGPLTAGPKAVEFFEGRVFYAGIPDSTWADYIFFSQLAQEPRSFGRCHTEADPTAPDNNQAVSTDGGFFVLPRVGNVIKMQALRDKLLIFSDEGVWEIGAGRNGFSPTSFSLRKITDAECDSPYSQVVVDNTMFFTGPEGVFQIGPNQYTGQLEAINVSDERIRTLWNQIGTTFRQRIQCVYDDQAKRLYFLHGGDGNKGEAEGDSSANEKWKTTFLILDLRVGAWYKYFFESATTDGIVHAFIISGAGSTDPNKKFKAIWQTSNTTVEICDFDQTNYVDEYDSNTESPLPYMYSGWDNLGDFSRRKQAPVVTVFQRRTETGYTDIGAGWIGDNESSTLMTALWDWTDNSVTGKVTSSQQVYRNVREFVPSSPTDENGYPVVVTRNKVRGRGRVLQLKFEGEARKDSHILGFTIHYKVSRRV